jgi:ethanolamine utilization protein EutP
MSKPNQPMEVPDLRVANKTQAAVYHPDFIDVPGEYLEVRSLYRALIMLTCEACGIALVQAANDEESLFPTGLARTFDKPVIGIVTKTDVISSDNDRAEYILHDAGAKKVFFTSALTNKGIVELTKHLAILRGLTGKGSNI